MDKHEKPDDVYTLVERVTAATIAGSGYTVAPWWQDLLTKLIANNALALRELDNEQGER